MKIINFNKIKSVIIGGALLPLLSFAQLGSRQPFGGPFFGDLNLFGSRIRPTSSFGLCYVIDIMNRFITWTQVILFSVAVIMALYAAFLFITGKGTNFAAARDVLIYAAIGVGVALLAYAIVPLVSTFLGVSYYEQCF